MFPVAPNSSGWIEVICGGMFAGKTEELIRRVRIVHYAKQNAVAIKPSIDDRFHGMNLASHSGNQYTGLAVSKASDIIPLLQASPIAFDVVGIDEAQFFGEDLVDVCQTLANEGKRVIVAGLDTDYRGVPFGPIPYLMATAEFVTKVHAVCTVCGSMASRSQRIVDSQEQVVVGGASAYEARCRKHWHPEPIFSDRDSLND